MLHIGIEIGDLLRPHRAGMARYTQSLLTALLRRAPLAEIHGWASWRRVLGLYNRPARIDVHLFGKTPPRQPPDIFHATGCVFPRWKSKIEIATVHDLLPIHQDLNLPPAEVRRLADYIYRSDRIICVSHYTRRHLHELLDIPPSRTLAVPLAVEARFAPASADDKRRVRNKYRLPEEFFLFVGRDRPNKNLDRLIVAYASTGLKVPLYIAGRQSRGARRRLAQLARSHRCAGEVRWLGSFSDNELPVLLSCASALCMPSTFEGFGLPIIEAMACGTAVLTSVGQATEEAAGGNAILIEPESVESIADGLHRVLGVEASQRTEARRYATIRTWDDVAMETLQVYGVSERSELAA